MPKLKVMRFDVTGTMVVKGRPQRAADGEVVSYKQKDGSTVRLIVALEVENKEGTKCQYLATDKQMRAIGFEIEQYITTDFK